MNRYSRNGTVHNRNIPTNWPEKPQLGRADVSLDALTDPICTAVEYKKIGRWRVRIAMSDMRDAMEGKAMRRGFMLQPFNIDVVAKTVNGKPTAMTVTLL